MRRLLVIVAALFALAVAVTPAALSADWSSGIGLEKSSEPVKAKAMCGGTVSCCDSPIADRFRSRSLQARGAVAVRKIRLLCGTIPDFPCGQWVYVGNGYYMYVPCRG